MLGINLRDSCLQPDAEREAICRLAKRNVAVFLRCRTGLPERLSIDPINDPFRPVR